MKVFFLGFKENLIYLFQNKFLFQDTLFSTLVILLCHTQLISGSHDLLIWKLGKYHSSITQSNDLLSKMELSPKLDLNLGLSDSIIYLNMIYQCLRPLSHHGWIDCNQKQFWGSVLQSNLKKIFQGLMSSHESETNRVIF